MLGSVHDADDALQEALLGAWRGRSGFEGRSSLRSWLYTIATNASLRILEGRKRRALPGRSGHADDPRAPLAEPLAESVWVEPYPDELLRYEDREAVELAYVAALQLLAPNQRAALLLREVLGFSAREAAEILGTSVASVNSALQRARAKLEREGPARSQQETLRALGDERSRELVACFVDAWNRADVPAIVAMLADDASFSMPPLPTWFRGRDDIAAFITARIFRSTWRFEPTTAGGQPAMVGHRPDSDSGREVLRALTVLTFEGEHISALTAFLGPGVLRRFVSPTDDFRP
jgi:RNA polymerase sigma-70 factor (ECF subfamily)